VEHDSDNSQLRMAALTALARWQRIAEHPLYAWPTQYAARTAPVPSRASSTSSPDPRKHDLTQRRSSTGGEF
jgi:hypothetical protein